MTSGLQPTRSHDGPKEGCPNKLGVDTIQAVIWMGRKYHLPHGAADPRPPCSPRPKTMDTHGTSPVSSSTHRPLPWCTPEHRRPRQSRSTHNPLQCHRSRSRAHKPHRRPRGPPVEQTSVCPGSTLPSQSQDFCLYSLLFRKLRLAPLPGQDTVT
jgi:hypothetical protein